MRSRAMVGLGLLLGATVAAHAQSINIDLDAFFGNSQSGNGAPSSAFGGAANSPGYWNRVWAGGPRDPMTLSGLDGNATSVQMLGTGGLGVGGGYNDPLNTGDYALLLNDYATVWHSINYHFSGLQPGRYLIYTYAVEASGLVVDTTVTVPGADDPVKHVTGPMPGNRFIEGITHSVHQLTLTGDSFDIELSGDPPDSSVNGFQIVATPEPGSFLILGLGLPLLLRRRRR